MPVAAPSKASLAEVALDLRRRGYVCVPLRRGGKHLDLAALGRKPIHLSFRNKKLKELAFTSVLYQLAQEPPDEHTLARWFRIDGCNLGLVCGVGGLAALDFDNPAIFQAWGDSNKALVTSTPICRTPKGYHVLLKCELPLISSSMHFGFRRAGHIKALGGYIACDPSTLYNGGAYRWLPGQSPATIDPQTVDSLADVGLHSVSPIKRIYDSLLGRGSFEDH